MVSSSSSHPELSDEFLTDSPIGFNRFPREVRDSIWKATLPDTRTFKVRRQICKHAATRKNDGDDIVVREGDCECNCGGNRHDDVKCDCSPRDWEFRLSAPPIQALQICRESRRVALKHFPTTSLRHFLNEIHYNLETDVFFFERCQTLHEFWKKSRTYSHEVNNSGIRRLELDLYTEVDDGRFTSPIHPDAGDFSTILMLLHQICELFQTLHIIAMIRSPSMTKEQEKLFTEKFRSFWRDIGAMFASMTAGGNDNEASGNGDNGDADDSDDDWDVDYKIPEIRFLSRAEFEDFKWV